MIADFNCKFELHITKKQAEQGSHPGGCDDDIKALLEIPSIRRQFAKINPEGIKAELKEYGAWDEEELNDVEANKARILWIACGNITDEINGC